ncbi:cytochrome c biogenesis protein ResB [Embleya sp. NBC_00896]|uniref:cytochrome c biogenesis protein ResB n=1 Tax=Embleya sp. NBC_00896 TaxID=2975961 RepID=UPI003868821B|nr:cytochrome c biogenesis protein ResB [Embleya sp. NBC_00896]
MSAETRTDDDLERLELPEARADAGMSTAPAQDDDGAEEIRQPQLGVVGWLRWLWRQLTSMRVALILLFMLSIAATPPTLIPQRPVSPIKVSQYFRDHPTRAKIMDKFQLFDVFASWWFASIYILLFISLAGCIVPRVWAHAKTLLSKPPEAPRNFARLPAYARWETTADPDAVLTAARAALKKRRFRLNPGTGSVSAEKGYARETGNLLFHIALFGILVAFALGSLYSVKGGKIVVEGQSFANVLTQYDDRQFGALVDEDNLEPFGFRLNAVEQTFQATGAKRGEPRSFTSHIESWYGHEGKNKKGTIKVNEPLQVGDTKVFMIATGYAPVVTVRDAKGKIAYSGPTVFLPQDGNRTSTGVIKVPDVSAGLKQLGFDGIFVPSTPIKPDGSFYQDPVRGWVSAFPALLNPALVLSAYEGDLGMDSGVPQNIYALKPDKMTQFKSGDQPWSVALKPGQAVDLPNGAGSLTFEGVKIWANFQVASEPGKGLALVSVVAAIVGLVLSLFVRRRRMWVRAVEGPDGNTVVEVGGLARTEGGGLGDEVQEFVDALRVAAPANSPGTKVKE